MVAASACLRGNRSHLYSDQKLALISSAGEEIRTSERHSWGKKRRSVLRGRKYHSERANEMFCNVNAKFGTVVSMFGGRSGSRQLCK